MVRWLLRGDSGEWISWNMVERYVSRQGYPKAGLQQLRLF